MVKGEAPKLQRNSLSKNKKKKLLKAPVLVKNFMDVKRYNKHHNPYQKSFDQGGSFRLPEVQSTVIIVGEYVVQDNFAAGYILICRTQES